MDDNAQAFRRLLGSLLSIAIGGAIVPPVLAQLSAPAPQTAPAPAATFPACQPPNPGEFLLLVVSKTPESQDQVRRVVPATTTPTVCRYLNDVVIRVGGFTSVDSADAWARYLTETVGTPTFIARSAGAPGAAATPIPAATNPPQPAPVVTGTSATYNPQPLGGGYAVLVDFFSRPDLAVQVQQALGKEIGLASYGQRPFLLAVYTTDQAAANATLQALSDRGFWAMVVDSRRVTLLRQPISLPPATARN